MSQLGNWISEGDHLKAQWAVRYLSNKGFVINPSAYLGGGDYNKLIALDRQHFLQPYYVLAVNKMKSAWRQKKIRETRKGKVEFSLVVSKEKKALLNKIAKTKNKTLGDTLEELIEEEKKREKLFKEEIIREKTKIREKLKEHSDAINALLYLLQIEIKKSVDSNVENIKLSSPTASAHSGTESIEEQAMLEVIDKISRIMRAYPSLKKKEFPISYTGAIEREREIKDRLGMVPKFYHWPGLG